MAVAPRTAANAIRDIGGPLSFQFVVAGEPAFSSIFICDDIRHTQPKCRKTVPKASGNLKIFHPVARSALRTRKGGHYWGPWGGFAACTGCVGCSAHPGVSVRLAPDAVPRAGRCCGDGPKLDLGRNSCPWRPGSLAAFLTGFLPANCPSSGRC